MTKLLRAVPQQFRNLTMPKVAITLTPEEHPALPLEGQEVLVAEPPLSAQVTEPVTVVPPTPKTTRLPRVRLPTKRMSYAKFVALSITVLGLSAWLRSRR